MELKSYLEVLRRRIWAILFTVIFAGAVTAAGSYAMLPQYSAGATLWIPTIGSTDGARSGDIQLGDRLINTYASLAMSGPVMRELGQRLNIVTDDLVDVITVESVPQTELLQVQVQLTDPQLAADVATTLSEILIDQTLATQAGRDRRVSLFARAGVPDTPTWMGFFETPFWREINIAIGLVVGLLAGIALAFFLDYMDSTLYTKEQIEAVAKLNTLGEIPVVRDLQPVALTGNTIHGEAFRYLRTSILFEKEVLPQTLMITSALPGEGKSTIVANLALALAQARHNVIVVDADLRLPSQHVIFGLSTQVGLTSILRQESVIEAALQQSNIPGIRVITSGPKVKNPGEILDSPHFVAFIEQLKQEADFILFDSPASLAVSDAAVIAPLVDGVLLVVGRAQSYQEAVGAARCQLISVGANLIGAVVNRADRMHSYYPRYVANGAVARKAP